MKTIGLFAFSRGIIFGMTLLFSACQTDDEADGTPEIGDPDYERDPALDVELTSQAGGTSSHKAGENCMHCHQVYGPGPGLFTAAGTAFTPGGTPQTGGTLELRTGPAGSGDLVLSVPVDANGNFYTTAALPLPDQQLFPTVLSPDGERYNAMPFPTASAACNMCHTGGARIVTP